MDKIIFSAPPDNNNIAASIIVGKTHYWLELNNKDRNAFVQEYAEKIVTDVNVDGSVGVTSAYILTNYEYSLAIIKYYIQD